MRQSVRDAVRLRCDFRCVYCGVSETETGARLTIDHFKPVAHGGTDDADNLVYACHACNEFKGDYHETDPDRALLHPLNDDLTAHIAETLTHSLVPLTEHGRVYIVTMRLNRVEAVARRRHVHRTAVRQEIMAEFVQRFDALEAEIAAIRKQLE